MGQRGRSWRFVSRRGARVALWISRIRARTVSSVAGQALMHERRIVALDEMRLVAVAAQQFGQLLRGRCAPAPSDWRS